MNRLVVNLEPNPITLSDETKIKIFQFLFYNYCQYQINMFESVNNDLHKTRNV